ncbi:MAG: hypothetical protein AAF416_09765, partial [Pseudomonadota bacterium]
MLRQRAGSPTTSVDDLDDDNDGIPDAIECRLDFLHIHQGSNTITILGGIGNGTFAAAAVQSITVNDAGIGGLENNLMGDVNGDGVDDIIHINSQNNQIRVWTGIGDGMFNAEMLQSIAVTDAGIATDENSFLGSPATTYTPGGTTSYQPAKTSYTPG